MSVPSGCFLSVLPCQLFQPRIPHTRRNKEVRDRPENAQALSKNARALTNSVDIFMPARKDDAQRMQALCYRRDSRYF